VNSVSPVTPLGTPAARGRGPRAALLLWQGPAEDAPDRDDLLLWHGAGQRSSSRSLTEYLDENGTEVRRRYLAWSFELGETPVMGRRLRERLRAGRAGSLWPVSMFVEQSTWKQASLEKILKVLALELLLERECPVSLAYAGADRDLSRVLNALCRERRVRYSWQRQRTGQARPPSRWWRALPQSLLGLALPVYFLIRSRRLPRPRTTRAPAGVKRVLICAPFINHTATAREARDFTSNYWTELPKLLRREGHELVWLHILYPHERIPTAAAAAEVAARIEIDSADGGSHGFVDAYFSVTGLLRMLAQWATVAVESVIVGLRLRVRFARRPRESFWPLLRKDWASAFRGIECAAALYYLECFDRALASLPHQDEGLYLMESQGWERALSRAWRRHHHGRLTAVAHSTLRFWDLRYHCDPRRYDPAVRAQMFGPDVVAVNGAQARQEFLATCASREPLVECEALRYLKLIPTASVGARLRTAGEPLRLLVLGDFLPGATEQLLRLVREALRIPGEAPELWVKAHPNCPVNAAQTQGLPMRLVDEPVASLAAAVDVVLASNTTSAALEAYLSNARVLVYDDRRGVNFSPLRSVSAVRFIHDASQLRAALGTACEARQTRAPRTAEFFHTDAALPRWRAYFGIGPNSPRETAARCSHPAHQEDLAT
jgi:surface carbohydrate biosynthesis protein (TIGR04326 family)